MWTKFYHIGYGNMWPALIGSRFLSKKKRKELSNEDLMVHVQYTLDQIPHMNRLKHVAQ